MNPKIDLLIIYPGSNDSLNDPKKITDYNSMQAHFVEQEIRKIKSLNIVSITSNMFPPKKTKKKLGFEEFKKELEKNNINLTDCKNILCTKLAAFKKLEGNTLDLILDSISGSMYKFEDKDFRLSNNERIQTIGHYTASSGRPNFFDAGLATATDLFKPNQDWESKIFKVHVDHNYTGQLEAFKEIKDILHELNRRIEVHDFWQGLEVTYHTAIESIDNIGHFSFTNTDIVELAQIYSESNLAFISHRESLGQYPLELLSCGVPVVLVDKRLMPKAVARQLPLIKQIDYDQILDVGNLQRAVYNNRCSVKNFDYSVFVSKIIEFIFY